MTGTPAFVRDPDGTREAIMTATYHALCEHGYADLTIQRISDRFEKSKSLIYHHYDSKDDLLLDFLEFMLEEFEDTIPQDDTDCRDHSDRPDDRLDAILDEMITAAVPAEHREFMRAMTELRAQAANDDRYREHFTQHDRFFRNRLADLVRTGVERGVFRDVDPDRVAAFLVTVITGSLTQRTTTEADVSTEVRDELRAYVERRLLADAPTEKDGGG